MESRNTTRRFPTLLWVTLAYFLLSLLLLAPVLGAFGQAIPGGPIAENDGWQNVWNLWWAGRALGHLQNPFFTSMLYYPTGASLYMQTLNITNGLLTAPVTWLAGPVASYNLCLLAAFTLSGLGAYLLAHHLTRNRGAAFIAGLAFAFSPFHLTKMVDGQLELLSTQWIPFFFLFLLRTIEQTGATPAETLPGAQDTRPSGLPLEHPAPNKHRGRLALAGNVIGTALFFVLVALTSWYYAFFSALLAGLVVLLWAVTQRERWKQTLLRAGVALGLGGLLLLPVLIPGVQALPSEDTAARQDYSSALIRLHATDLLDPFLPSTLHPLWGKWAHSVGLNNHPGLGNAAMPLVAGWNAALGYTALAVAVLGLVVAWRRTWRWGLLLLTTLVLAMGPTLQIAGRNTGVPLPYALLNLLPGIERARRPSHFVILSTLLLALLVAFGVDWLLKRLAGRWRLLLGIVLVLAIGFEYLPQPLPRLFPRTHPYYTELAADEGAILNLPPRDESSEPMVAQIVHGRPISGGYLSRTPSYPFAEQVPGVRELWAAQTYPRDILTTEADTGLIALRAFGFQHLVVYLDQLGPKQEEELSVVIKQILGDVHPALQDHRLAVYEIPSPTLRPFAYLGDGWYDLEPDRRRWIGEQATLQLVNPLTQTVGIVVRVEWHSYERPRTVALYLDELPLGPIELPAYRTGQQFGLLLPPGAHALTFRAETDLEAGPAGRQLSVSFFALAVQQHPAP